MKLFDRIKNFHLFKNFKLEPAQEPTMVGSIKRAYAKLRGSSFSSGFSSAAFKLSYQTLFNAYRNNADVSGCIREWEENVGAAGWFLEVPNDPEAEVMQWVTDDLTEIFNFYDSWSNILKRVLRDLGIAGNHYWLLVRNVNNEVIGVQPMDPRTISIISDKFGTIHKYIQRSASGTTVQEFEPNEVVHFKRGVDPDHEVYGFSPTEPIIWDARTDIAAMLANYAFFENSALPAAQYILDDGLSDEDQEAAIKLIKKNFKGSKNRHKGGILAGVKEIKILSISQKDMEFLNGRRFSTEKICSAYGVPKFFLGYTDSVNNNNAIELRKTTFEGTFKPLETNIAETITRQLINRIGLKGKVKFNFNIQAFEEQANLEKRGLEEYRNGILTLRQYKLKTNQVITKEDELNPNIDRHIMQQGMSAVLLEDVGEDPFDLSIDEKLDNLTKSLS